MFKLGFEKGRGTGDQRVPKHISKLTGKTEGSSRKTSISSALLTVQEAFDNGSTSKLWKILKDGMPGLPDHPVKSVVS